VLTAGRIDQYSRMYALTDGWTTARPH